MKKQLAHDLCQIISPIRERILQYQSDNDLLETIAERGAEKARESAAKTLREVREIVGFRPDVR